jgi:hypothetical protein
VATAIEAALAGSMRRLLERGDASIADVLHHLQVLHHGVQRRDV